MLELVTPVHARVAPEELLDLERLYREEGPRLLGMLCAYVGDRGEAEDVLQEAFLRVQRGRDRIEHPAKAAAYLRSTAFNLARSGLRRRLRRPDPLRRWLPPSADDGVVQFAEPDVSDGLILEERQRAVLDALLSLPARQRACVVLRYYGGLALDDICSELGISRNSVKTHLRRGLDSLGHQLEALR